MYLGWEFPAQQNTLHLLRLSAQDELIFENKKPSVSLQSPTPRYIFQEHF